MNDAYPALLACLQILLPPGEEPWGLDGWGCGGLCAGLEHGVFARLCLPEQAAASEHPHQTAALRDYLAMRQTTLTGFDTLFEPIIATDAEPLQERLDSLAVWCGGFLLGMNAGTLRPESSDALETLEFMEAVAAGASAAGDAEQQEVEFLQIVEFVKVGVSLVFLELQTRRKAWETGHQQQ